MKCPHCNVPLVMTERQGVEIDYCPQCRGVWLDRGELDKILERQAALEGRTAAPAPQQPAAPKAGYGAPPPPPPPYRPRDDDDDDDDRYKHGGHGGHGGGYYPKHKKSWLSELFD